METPKKDSEKILRHSEFKETPKSARKSFLRNKVKRNLSFSFAKMSPLDDRERPVVLRRSNSVRAPSAEEFSVLDKQLEMLTMASDDEETITNFKEPKKGRKFGKSEISSFFSKLKKNITQMKKRKNGMLVDPICEEPMDLQRSLV